MKKYRLISIGEKEDYYLDRLILYVELTPIKENKLLNGYSFYESEKEVFIFLLEKRHKEYFLTNPEDIKHINLESFELGEFRLSHFDSIKAYRNKGYIEILDKIMEKRKRGKKLAELRKSISKNKNNI